MQIFTLRPVCDHHRRVLVKFGHDWLNGCRVIAILQFPIWRPSAILDSLYACAGPLQSGIVGLHHCAKFGLNRLSSFDNIEVWRFLRFGWKLSIHAPILVVLEAYFPQMTSSIILIPKGPSLRGYTSFEPWSVKIGPTVWPVCRIEKKTGLSEKSQKGYISPIWGEAPAEPNSTKISMMCDVHDVIMSAKFHV